MNRYKNRSLFLIFILVFACSPAKQAANVESWTEDQVNKWFSKKEWIADAKLYPDSSINRKEFAVQ